MLWCTLFSTCLCRGRTSVSTRGSPARMRCRTQSRPSFTRAPPRASARCRISTPSSGSLALRTSAATRGCTLAAEVGRSGGVAADCAAAAFASSSPQKRRPLALQASSTRHWPTESFRTTSSPPSSPLDARPMRGAQATVGVNPAVRSRVPCSALNTNTPMRRLHFLRRPCV